MILECEHCSRKIEVEGAIDWVAEEGQRILRAVYYFPAYMQCVGVESPYCSFIIEEEEEC